MNLPYILLALVFFGLLIFIHELGHFIVARLCGVKILEFSIGMGPKLFSIKSKKSGTAYSLRLLPLGGYVSMLGENGMEAVQGPNQAEEEKTQEEKEESKQFFSVFSGEHLPDEDEEAVQKRKETDAEPVKLDPELAKHAYCNQSVWKKILISIAGPLMNVVLGFVLMAVLVLCAGEEFVGSTQVASLYMTYSAETPHGDLQKGDVITEVRLGESSARSMEQLRALVSKNENATFTVSYSRSGSGEKESQITLNTAVLEACLTKSVAETEGLQAFDIVKKVNRTSVHTANELYYEIMNQGGYEGSLKLTVERNGETIIIDDFLLKKYEESGVTIADPDFGVFREDKFNFPTIIKHAFWRSCSTVKMVFDSLKGLFSGHYGMEAVSGPIGITEVITDAAKTSALDVLNLLVLISINLGIMNLLPFPALDGGHILLYLIEAIRRKPLKPEVEGMINFIGLVLLLGFAILISIKDVISL